MLFKKKILFASVYYNSKHLYLIKHSKDTNGLNFMSGLVKLNRDDLKADNFGQEVLRVLQSFVTRVSPPLNVSLAIKPILKEMGCKSWNSLFEKFEMISLEGVKSKYVYVQPGTKETQGKNKFYSTQKDDVVKVSWDARNLANVLLEVMNNSSRTHTA